MTTRAYAGIGSRSTPPDILQLMHDAAEWLEHEGLILRSGGAEGADEAFETAIRDKTKMEIYLPWESFRGRSSNWPGYYLPEHGNYLSANNYARKYHPKWHGLKGSMQMLMCRNTYQVLGRNCDDPALFVLCWTPGGSGEGGTGQAIRIAHAKNIPVFDLGNMSPDTIAAEIEKILAA